MISRRRLFQYMSAGLVSAALAPSFSFARETAPLHDIKAIAFDAFPVFDPRPIFKNTRSMFPEKGEALHKLWFAKLFGYTWLRSTGAQYRDFLHVAEEALAFAADDLGITVTTAQQTSLMQSFLALPLWPDVASALQRLREAGIRLGFLSNMTEQMLAANIAHNGIGDLFECVISTDRAQAFKPAPQAYQLGVDAFGLPKENIAFAAFAGWDAAGAKWFGYPTVWVNRLDATAERLGAAPDKMTQDMGGLVAFALPSRSSISK